MTTAAATQGTLFKAPRAVIARITAIRWRAKDSARCIVLATDEVARKSFSAVGDIEEPTIGQLYEFEGTFSYNDRFKTDELRFTSYRTVIPTDTQGIERYLTDTAKWVGHATARELTKLFGQDTLNIIKQSPERVAAAVNGITIERAQQMQKSLLDNEKNECAAVEVAQILGASVPGRFAKKAIKKWGANAAIVIRRNPFKLAELPGIGFASADAVWRSLKLPLNHPRRHAAAILHVLAEKHAMEGHTIISETSLAIAVRELVGSIDRGILHRLEKTRRIIQPTRGTWSLAEINNAERYIAQALDWQPRDKTNEDEIIVATDGLAPDQIEAAKLFAKCPVFILTGAPGTGKTYTVARFVQAMQGRTVLLCAPTGKAAKQMTNALEATCGGVARTIHSTLGPELDEETGEFSFQHNEENPIGCSAIVIDETSMVDIRLARQLLSALRSGTRILFVGDRHQLPSVGPGSFLRDLIAADVPSFELTEIKRNSGRIVKACHTIKDGQTPEPSDRLDLTAGENWRHIEADDPQVILEIIDELYRSKIPGLGITSDLRWDTQCVAPLNERGSLSCADINKLIQSILNPNRQEEEHLLFSIGDKVVRLKNGEVKGQIIEEDANVKAEELQDAEGSRAGLIRVVNGDLGIVENITKSEIIVEFQYPRRRAILNRREHQLRLAYCMTCHKMQGSEAPIIVLPLHRQFSTAPIWTREWIYTAMSRAKLALITVGQIGQISTAVARVGNVRRKTQLKELLISKRQGGPLWQSQKQP